LSKKKKNLSKQGDQTGDLEIGNQNPKYFKIVRQKMQLNLE
jgi:hypothetical protein